MWDQNSRAFFMAESTLDKVINLCKRRGFVFPCGDIYGGTKAAWRD